MSTTPPAAPPISSPTSRAPASADLDRAALRSRLLAARASLHDRAARQALLVDRLRRWLGTVQVRRLAFHLPNGDEPDVTPVVVQWLKGDPQRVAALPVRLGELPVFARWAPGAPVRVGPPGSATGELVHPVVPQMVLLPCIGLDAQRYRLGYGEDWYDRTVAMLSPRPVTVGVAFACAAVGTIGPQPGDIRLDLAVTDARAW
jgi:5,10-methenyltetrahydrofolate synthetase